MFLVSIHTSVSEHILQFGPANIAMADALPFSRQSSHATTALVQRMSGMG
jgi:hypothetical protein